MIQYPGCKIYKRLFLYIFRFWEVIQILHSLTFFIKPCIKHMSPVIIVCHLIYVSHLRKFNICKDIKLFGFIILIFQIKMPSQNIIIGHHKQCKYCFSSVFFSNKLSLSRIMLCLKAVKLCFNRSECRRPNISVFLSNINIKPR